MPDELLLRIGLSLAGGTEQQRELAAELGDQLPTVIAAKVAIACENRGGVAPC